MKLSPKFKSAVASAARTTARKTGAAFVYDLYSGGLLMKAFGIQKSRIAPLRGTGSALIGALSAASAAYAPFASGPSSPLFAEPIISYAPFYFTASAMMMGLYSAVLWSTAAAEVHLERTYIPELRKQAEREEKARQDEEQRRYARIFAREEERKQKLAAAAAAAAAQAKPDTNAVTQKETEPCNLPNNPPANPPAPPSQPSPAP
jgi:hypothetical protein